MAQLFISAAHKSSGKTTISIGLCEAFKTQGVRVQPFKKGPDYIDPMWLSRVAGRPCYNLDFYTSGADEILATVGTHSRGADISLIEGNKGLYDGLDLNGSNSNAALAKMLGSPIVLVIDARGMTRGIAPLILGYQAFDPNINIAGVILNNVGGSRHENKLRRVIEHYTSVPVIGAVHRSAELELQERHLGLIPSNERRQADAKISAIGRRVQQQVDLEQLLAIAASAPWPPRERRRDRVVVAPTDIRIGIARDAAFGFYYPDDLEALERAGAELLPIDTLTDQRLPSMNGLFIGGGFPETQMVALEKNAALRAQIRDAIEAGLPTYAECGGLMYLSRNLTWKGRTAQMVGVIDAETVMHDRPQGRGYVRLRETAAHLWPLLPDEAPAEIAAHEFHYSRIENIGPGLPFAYQVQRGTGLDGHHDGLVYKNLLACYSHRRQTRNDPWAKRFVKFARSCKHAEEMQQSIANKTTEASLP